MLLQRNVIFWKRHIDFLSFIVGKDIFPVNEEKVEILKTWLKPNTVTDIRNYTEFFQAFNK